MARRAAGSIRRGNVLATDTEQDITVDYRYDSAGRLVTMTAYNADGTTVTSQATKYLYTSTINASWQTGVVYPDSTDVLSQDSDGVWTFTTDNGDHASTTYDRLGRVTSTTDQRGVVHNYSYGTTGGDRQSRARRRGPRQRVQRARRGQYGGPLRSGPIMTTSAACSS